MRLTAIIGALMFAAVVFVADGQTANAQAQNQQPNPKITEVKPGDTLSRIAAANETTYNRLFDANLDIKDPDVIYPGNKVRIPEPNEQLISRALPVDVPAPAPAPAPKKQVTAPAPAPKPQPRKGQATAAPAVVVSGGIWDRLAQCESGGNWSINTGNGFYGGLQFTLSSWRAVGGSGYPHQASKSEQIARAERLRAIQGWGAWPACSSKLGLR